MANEKLSAVDYDDDDEDDVHWVRAEAKAVGIVVATTWMMCKPRHFVKHSRLYASCGWDSLVAHPKFMALWVPGPARTLATRILDKLLPEVQARPRPVVFATFSGGLKACLYKIFEMLDGSDGAVDSPLKKYRIVRDCYAGQIQDSSPVDFVSSNGAYFVTHPTTLGTSRRSAALTRSARLVGRALDALFLPTWEVQRKAMWASAETAARWGPVLLFCSKDDDLAPFEVIQSFSSRISDLGCQVKLIVWDESTHVTHLQRHREEYSGEVVAFLSAAASLFATKEAHESARSLQPTDGHGSICRSATAGWACVRQHPVVQTSARLKFSACGTNEHSILSRM